MRMFTALKFQAKVSSFKLGFIHIGDSALSVLGTALCTYFTGKALKKLDLKFNMIGARGF